jgi:elongation factor Ts
MDIFLIKQLREETGASIADCKVCLEEAQGDTNKAKELLRRKGVDIANRKSSRIAKEGVIGIYLHSNGKIASMVKVRCETDFVARNEEFKELAKDLAMQVAGMNPLYRLPEDVPEDVKSKEMEIETEKLQKAGKPNNIIPKILEGKMSKFYEQVCLTKQLFIKDDKKTIEHVVQEKIQKLGENIEIGEFVRMEL